MRKNAAEKSKEEQAALNETDERLRQWGLVYRGGFPHIAIMGNHEDTRPTLDELGAAVTERAMCNMKRRGKRNDRSGRYHRRLYRLIWYRYQEDKPDWWLAREFRISEYAAQEMHKKALRAAARYISVELNGHNI